MSRIDQVRVQYQTMFDAAPEGLKPMYQGILMGLELGAGAAAQDRADELKQQNAELLAQTVDLQQRLSGAEANGNGRTWSRPAPTNGALGARTRDMDQLVQVYALSDPLDEDNYFYVGSAVDASQQVKDYTRTPGAKVSCKPTLDKLAEAGLEPSLTVLESGVAMREASARKTFWIGKLAADGAVLSNQRA